jgi:hypothetical protein
MVATEIKKGIEIERKIEGGRREEEKRRKKTEIKETERT